MDKKLFVDASAFLGLHMSDEVSRARSIRFFASNLNNRINMSLEQVGICDDVIWSYSRALQDDYFPFMDLLHTQVEFCRMPYLDDDLEVALNNTVLNKLPISKALILAQVINRNGVLFTLDKELVRYMHLAKLESLYFQEELDDARFDGELGELYKRSSVLQVSSDLHSWSDTFLPHMSQVDNIGHGKFTTSAAV